MATQERKAGRGEQPKGGASVGGASVDGASVGGTARAGSRVPECAPLREERDQEPNPTLDPQHEAEAKVDESSDDSFPASDAPSWTPVQGTSDAATATEAERDEREHANDVEPDEAETLRMPRRAPRAA